MKDFERPPGLEFVIVGAMKGGTTTLFDHLKRHPDIYMPPGKELPFFDREHSATDLRRYLNENFPASRVGLRGKASPSYLRTPDSARRLSAALPGIRVIAVLRDPISRAYSHYRMNVRRGIETHEFVEGALTWLAQGREGDIYGYFGTGCYGEQLKTYRESFSSSSVHVDFTDHLERAPQHFLDAVTEFLDVDRFVPPDVGLKSHVGGLNERIPVVRRISRTAGGRLAKRMMPERQLADLRLRFSIWNSKPEPVDSVPLPDDVRRRLQDRYRSDAEVIRELGYIEPWTNRW